MMVLNRHRLKHLLKRGQRGAKTTHYLLKHTDRLLSTILIGNNVINTAIPVMTVSITLNYFGKNGIALSVTTAIVAFVIVVFAEIIPKVLGATFPERIALPASLLIKPLMRLLAPVLWLLHLLTSGILRFIGIKNHGRAQQDQLSIEELRSVVLESTHLMSSKHSHILRNLFDLEDVSVDDIMTPRARIEALDLALPLEAILHQLETCYHNTLLVYHEDINTILGILHVRKTLSALRHQELTLEAIQSLLSPAYFVPSGTAAFRQLHFFQENHSRVALVVNEYGEVVGLLTPEDIIEELIGKFTTNLPDIGTHVSGWDEAGEYLAPGSTLLRELNRQLGLSLSLSGPKTLNGLILETLREIPDVAVCLEVGGCRMEIIQTDHQAVKTVKLFKPLSLAIKNDSL